MKAMLMTLLLLQALYSATGRMPDQVPAGLIGTYAPPSGSVTPGIQDMPCILFEDFVEYEDGTNAQSWTCVVYGADAWDAGSSHMYATVHIEGISHVLSANSNIESGGTTLLASGASLSNYTLTITSSTDLTFGKASDHHVASRRRLSSPSGDLSVLVVRVSTPDSSLAKSRAEISGDIFGTAGSGDTINFKSQAETCSNNAVTINPADGTGSTCLDDANAIFDIPTYNGAPTFNCDYFNYYYYETQGDMCDRQGTAAQVGNPGESANTRCCICGGGDHINFDNNVVDGVMELQLSLSASGSTSDDLKNAAVEELEDLFYVDHLTERFDHVMFCLPHGATSGGSTGWVAYAGLPGYYSVYNGDQWCANEATLMHEIGHNWGLHHASEGSVEYGDTTAVMGSTIGAADDSAYGNKMCFNGAHSWQLGWYTAFNREIDPLETCLEGTLVGVDRIPNLSSGENFVVKLTNSVTDYYIIYNHAVGVNEGTTEAANLVTITTQAAGAHVKTFLVATLDQGESATFSNWDGSGHTVTVTVESISTDASTGNAYVMVSSTAANSECLGGWSTPPAPTPPAPTPPTPTPPTPTPPTPTPPTPTPPTLFDGVEFEGNGCVDYIPNDGWTALPRNDDEGYIRDMGITFNWLGQDKTSIYVNTNGALSFDDAVTSYQPQGFTAESQNMIAAFWADVDTTGNVDGYVWYKTTDDNRFVVTWEEVARYGGDYSNPLRNTFQIILSDKSYANSHICFCYDNMEWTLGSVTHTGHAQVGISGGPGNYFNLAQFDRTDDTWNGVGTDGNGAQYLEGKGFCFDDNAINVPPTESSMLNNPPREESDPGTGGDPHITTWQNEHFEYHGQCDLTLVKDPEFAEGLGLDIQIRTKVVRYWSYIKSVAIKIGNDILEVEGSPDASGAEARYWINFEYQGDLDSIAGFPVTHKVSDSNPNKRVYTIDLRSKYRGASISFEVWKEFVRVRFSGRESVFGNSVGLMGDYKTGKTLARDGTTVMNDFTEFGDEWQVLPSEPRLFHEVSHPQFPELCIQPDDPRGERKRRLEESNISIEQAEAACAKTLKDPLSIKDCVYDILATQDMDMVGAF